jgi:hypothetical protein
MTNKYGRTRTTATHNKFAIVKIAFSADPFVQGGSSVLRMNFSAEKPRHRKSAKRFDPEK